VSNLELTVVSCCVTFERYIRIKNMLPKKVFRSGYSTVFGGACSVLSCLEFVLDFGASCVKHTCLVQLSSSLHSSKGIASHAGACKPTHGLTAERIRSAFLFFPRLFPAVAPRGIPVPNSDRLMIDTSFVVGMVGLTSFFRGYTVGMYFRGRVQKYNKPQKASGLMRHSVFWKVIGSQSSSS
jgi:hypothetical protein